MNEPSTVTKGVAEPLLEVHNLRVWVTCGGRRMPILQGVSLNLPAGQTLVVSSPSGSGKTTLALALMRLLPREDYAVQGSIRLEGVELSALTEEQMRALRGSRMGLVLQDAHASLNPLLTTGVQIAEALVEHGRADWDAARDIGLAGLQKLGFDKPERYWDSRPGQLSGGMKQRVCLAMAMLLRPSLLLLDEPTANLDWETKGEVLNAIDTVRSSTRCGVLWLTHDDTVMRRYMSDTIVNLSDLQGAGAG
jgi:ABC-type glutathione transport system ATPase component